MHDIPSSLENLTVSKDALRCIAIRNVCVYVGSPCRNGAGDLCKQVGSSEIHGREHAIKYHIQQVRWPS